MATRNTICDGAYHRETSYARSLSKIYIFVRYVKKHTTKIPTDKYLARIEVCRWENVSAFGIFPPWYIRLSIPSKVAPSGTHSHKTIYLIRLVSHNSSHGMKSFRIVLERTSSVFVCKLTCTHSEADWRPLQEYVAPRLLCCELKLVVWSQR
jgi:hypothetical protein